VRRQVGAQRGPLGAVELLGVREALFCEADAADGGAGRGREVREEGDSGLDAGVEAERIRRVEDACSFGVDLVIEGK